jgi:hypothetical protein
LERPASCTVVARITTTNQEAIMNGTKAITTLRVATLALGVCGFSSLALAQTGNGSNPSSSEPESGNITQGREAAPKALDQGTINQGTTGQSTGSSMPPTTMNPSASQTPEKPSCTEDQKNANRC